MGIEAEADGATPLDRGEGVAVVTVSKIHRATHTGVLRIGDMAIPCAVLEDGTRVLSERAVMAGLGVGRGGQLLRSATGDTAGGRLPLYVGQKALRPFIDNDLALVLANPVRYHNPKGGRFVNGLDAKLIPQILDIWLRARDAGVLEKRQERTAAKADMLMRALAHVGIIALVDEATGYQRERARDALAKILEFYISKELAKYARTFPDDFYFHLFRLRGWTVSDLNKRPGYTAQLTNDIVYARLAPGVLDELKRVQERGETGRPKHPLYGRLTPEWGHPKLREHLAAVTALMKVSENWGGFQRLLNRAL
ncbi:MAG TPA: P63C domain-containing protein, partial [Armatimonadota bacterium]|nr:P63C domain-containing protein [Armatimonadota bacterium]